MFIPWFQPEVSIDDVSQDASGSLSARLVDAAAESQEEKMYRSELTQLVRRALVNLNEREQYIIKNRYGFQGGDERSLEKIAAGLNLSRERVRQLECIAKNKLRKYLACCVPSSLLPASRMNA